MSCFQYESLRNNATTMKERYEEQIEELESERDSLTEKLETAKAEGGGTSGGAGTGNLLEEVCYSIIYIVYLLH